MARCCLPQERRAKRLPRPQWLERSRSLARADNVNVMSPRADAQGRWEVCFAVEPDRRKRPGSIETHGGDRRDDYFRNHKLLVIVHHRVSVTGFLFNYFKQTRKVTFRPVPRFLLS